ncbi:RNA polymerase II-binding domain-containing protein 2 [Elsinoe australis]|uniref:RNA polymerase II-binding domain-containing protein 2 n=1 Tax=Elsinoe australis TaxID=40998 RepID=A0A4U7ASN9_9PEZI|nr:RNA polymerase II-binding domain-containing protein 2 [Elsinoe australis]
MSQVDELDALLQSLQALKPPGASKSKITAITQFCVDNIHLDSTIAQKLYSNFRKTLPTHKLGILFVLDSVTRQWIEKAKASGQELGIGSAPNGTYASGVQRMTELLPSLIDETLRMAPSDQKAKVQNLVDIWERGNTFPSKMIADFKQKLQGPAPYVPSRTPPGSPPLHLLHYLGLRKPATQPPAPANIPAPITLPPQVSNADATAMLRALAGMVLPQSPAPTAQPAQAMPSQPDLSALLAGLGQSGAVPLQPPPAAIPQQYQQYAYPPQPVQTHSFPPQLAALYPGQPAPQPVPPPQVVQQAPATEDLATIIARLVPPHILADPEKVAQIAQLFDGLLKNGIPQDQWGPVFEALYPQAKQAPAAPVQQIPDWHPAAQNGRADESFGSYGSRKRDRSRSPDYRRGGGANGNRRPSPVYGVYDSSAKDMEAQQNADGRGGRGKGGNRYRQRSPPRNGNSMPNMSGIGASREKYISHDPTLPPNHIKVLSRTLFVGGCSARDAELRNIFERFGPVQTCITNLDKRHAFVKMSTRQGAVAARAGMDELSQRDPAFAAKARQTKWGVGFGPRECCDYSNGESTIPIGSLTEADIKWCLTAENGGTGGRDIVPGMVIEEPDIEIGAGVSSKAMSKRVGPEMGKGGGGGGGGRRGDGHKGSRQFRKGGGADAAMGAGGGYGASHEERFNSPRPQEQVAYQPPPPVPNFGFQFALPGQGPPY